MDGEEIKVKKVTPASVCKKYNLSAVELDELLDQIYSELEKHDTDETSED